MDKVEVFKKQFLYYKSLGEKAILQVSDEELFYAPDTLSNSIAVIMKHIAGNMLSRWTNIFEEDGEKPWRNRDDEFINSFETRKEVLLYWEEGWSIFFQTLESLKEEDLEKIIYIRNMGTTVHDAVIRQLCHYPYHIGQIVSMAKYFRKESFTSLSIPKGTSELYNDNQFSKEKTIKHFTDDSK